MYTRRGLAVRDVVSDEVSPNHAHTQRTHIHRERNDTHGNAGDVAEYYVYTQEVGTRIADSEDTQAVSRVYTKSRL